MDAKALAIEAKKWGMCIFEKKRNAIGKVSRIRAQKTHSDQRG
jgi:hypothetical protein